MKKKYARMTLSGLAGVLTGGVLVVVLLSIIGASYKDTDSQKEFKSSASASSEASATPTSSSTVSPTPASPSPTVSLIGYIEFKKGGLRYKLPEGYRVAKDLNKFDEENSPQSTMLTITKGTQKQEQDYITLVKQLQGDRAATEAPQFLPGRTISIFVSNSNAEENDARSAKSKEEYKTKAGLSANVYRRVEGLFTYDSAYVRLPNDKLIEIQMSYASEAPFFDDKAFRFVFDSLISNEK